MIEHEAAAQERRDIMAQEREFAVGLYLLRDSARELMTDKERVTDRGFNGDEIGVPDTDPLEYFRKEKGISTKTDYRSLTPSEMTVLEMFSPEITTPRKVAQALGHKERTVRNRITSIYNKLEIRNNGKFISHLYADGFIEPFITRNAAAHRQPVEPLTEKEVQTIQATVDNSASSKELGALLERAPHTIDRRYESISRKLGATTRVQAMIIALQLELVRPVAFEYNDTDINGNTIA